MKLNKGDKIFFTNNPKLNKRHTYEVLMVAGTDQDSKVKFKNLTSGNIFEYFLHQLVVFGAQIKEKDEVIIPVNNNCNHDEVVTVVFSTFSFRQCKHCKADLGDA